VTQNLHINFVICPLMQIVAAYIRFMRMQLNSKDWLFQSKSICRTRWWWLVLCLVAGTYFLCCPLMTESLTCVTFDIARFYSVHQLQISSHNIWHSSEFI
jgi:uncharacterized membrane protein